jgi:hypothetical protein
MARKPRAEMKPVKMWAAMNFDCIWGIHYRRKDARAQLVRDMTYPGQTTACAEHVVQQRIRRGELSVQPVLVTPAPRKRRKR